MHKGLIAALMAVLLLAAGTATAHMGRAKGFTEENTIIKGTFVSFEFNKTTGNITNYTLTAGEKGPRSVRVFTTVTIENFSTPEMGEAQTRTMGAVFKAFAGNASIKAIDNPVGHLNVANKGFVVMDDISAVEVSRPLPAPNQEARNTINFTLDPSLNAGIKEVRPDGSVAINITGEQFRGFLIVSAGSVEIAGDLITVKLVGPESVHFHGLPLFSMAPSEAAFEERMAEQAVRGRLAARIELRPEAAGQVQMVDASFRRSFQVTMQAAVENKLSLQLTSDEAQGAIVVLEISGELIQLDRQLRVYLDGKQVVQSPSLDLVIEAISQGNAQPAVYLLKTPESLKLSVYIPHFSTRTLTVEAVSGEFLGAGLLTNSTFWVLLGAVAAIGTVGVVAAVRRRQ